MAFFPHAPDHASGIASRPGLGLICIALALSSAPASAGYFGLPNGRTADLERGPELTVEAGLASGDIGEVDYEHTGARINYRYSPDVTAFADIGRSSVGDPDGTSFGLGLHYAVEGLLPGRDTSIRAAYHQAEVAGGTRRVGGRDPTDCAIDNQLLNNAFNAGPFLVPGVSGPPLADCGAQSAGRSVRGADVKLDSLSVEFVVSGRESLMSDRNLRWYASAGIHRLGNPSGNETEIGFGGGVVMALTRGELYLAADLIDEMSVGIGFRYHVDR